MSVVPKVQEAAWQDWPVQAALQKDFSSSAKSSGEKLDAADSLDPFPSLDLPPLWPSTLVAQVKRKKQQRTMKV